MSSNRIYIVIVFTFLSIFAVPTTAQQNPKVPQAQKIELRNCSMKNLYRIDNGVYRSDQPDANDFKALEGMGIKEVINLRNYHNDNNEAQGTSIVLHHLRTKASTINELELVKVLKLIKNRKGDILIHCWHGSDRTGAVVAMYRIIFQGVDKITAIDEMTDGGFGFHWMFDQIVDVIKGADVEKIRKELGITI